MQDVKFWTGRQCSAGGRCVGVAPEDPVLPTQLKDCETAVPPALEVLNELPKTTRDNVDSPAMRRRKGL